MVLSFLPHTQMKKCVKCVAECMRTMKKMCRLGGLVVIKIVEGGSITRVPASPVNQDGLQSLYVKTANKAQYLCSYPSDRMMFTCMSMLPDLVHVLR